MTQTPATFAFAGGLDTNSAALAMEPGCVISSFNYEPLAEGYGRIEGHERFDGQFAPSKARFALVRFAKGFKPFSYGQQVEGGASSATATVIADPIDFTGSWDQATAAGTLLVSGVEGAFVAGEMLFTNDVPFAEVVDHTNDRAADDATTRDYRRKAMEWQRRQIGKVPGTGPVRGVAVHDGEVYAFRDTEDEAYCQVFKATPTGWQGMNLVTRLGFSGGKFEPFIGGNIVGGTTDTSAKIVSVVQQDGDYADGTASGFIDIIETNGTFGNESVSVDGQPFGSITSRTPQRIAAGGRIRTISHNFYGAANRYRLYGTCDGRGNAFELLPEWGPTTISTGMAIDAPVHVFEIGNHLGLTFPGGSLQFSGTGEPNVFDPLIGAAEIGFGTEITDIVQANETAVAIFGESKIAMLQGSGTDDFVLDTLTEEAGAEPDTAQRIARTVYIDRRGMRSLDATQAYGNFKTGSLSGRFERYFRVKRDAGTKAIGSYVCKAKSQYRLVWDDGTALVVYMGGKNPVAMTVGHGDLLPYSFGAGELADSEGMFIGGEDGYVYRIDSGNSFDGDRIRAFVMTPFNHFGNPQQDSRFHWVALEMDAPSPVVIGITVQYDYGDGYQPISGQRDFTADGSASSFLVQGGGGLWSSAIWNEFYWSAPVESRLSAPIDGIGRNASFVFASQAQTDEGPHVFQAYTVNHSPRKIRRGA